MKSLILFLGLLAIVYSKPLQYTGGAESGAEFGGQIPGVYGTNYIYPSNFSIDTLAAEGMNIFRIPFLWERMQWELNQPLNLEQLGYLRGTVAEITKRKAYSLLDPHNYARYRGHVIGGKNVTNADFQNFWTLLAAEFKDNPLVIFGLMNEPHDMPTEQWLAAANAGIAGIRSTGAKNLITVPGNGWTGASSWTTGGYGTPNGVVMRNVSDPANNFVFEVHQYLDAGYSGSSPNCVSETIGVETLKDFTAWCKQYGYRGFIGEFAGGVNTVCRAAVGNMLDFMEQNSEQWAGFSWWAAGPWWGSYMYSIEPYSDGQNKPQMAWLRPHLQNSNVLQK